MTGLGDPASQLLRNLFVEIAAGIAVSVIISFSAYLLSDWFRSWVRRVFNYAFDTKVQVDLSRVDRYGCDPTGSLNMQCFKSAQKEVPELTFESLDAGRMRVSAESLSTQLEIRLEEQVVLNDSASSPRHEVKVGTYTPMTFGYRSDDCLNEFERISQDISKVVGRECFDNAQPQSSFVTGTLYGQAPLSEEELEDESVGMRMKVRDSSLELKFEDPRVVSQGIRKYFKPI